MTDAQERAAELEAYLRRIRKSIADGEELVRQADRRLAETDRLLASQGYTREQVLAMKFTDEQLAAANAEFERRGFPKITFDEPSSGTPESLSPAAPAATAAETESDDGYRGRMLRRMTWVRI